MSPLDDEFKVAAAFAQSDRVQVPNALWWLFSSHGIHVPGCN